MDYPLIKPVHVTLLEEAWEDTVSHITYARMKYEENPEALADEESADRDVITSEVGQSGSEILYISSMILEQSGWGKNGMSQCAIFKILEDKKVITNKTAAGIKNIMHQRDNCFLNNKELDVDSLKQYLDKGYLAVDLFLNDISAYLDWQKSQPKK